MLAAGAEETRGARLRRVLDSGVIDAPLLLALLLLLLLLTPFGVEGDGATRFRALSALLSRRGISGTAYSMIGPLMSAPLWWIGRLHGTSEWWCARFNFAVFVVGLGAFSFTLTPVIGRRTMPKFLLILTVASMFPHHDSRYYGEVFTAV